MEDVLYVAALDDDENDDDVDDLLLHHLFNNENLGPRADIYGRFDLDHISDMEAKALFRFEKRDILRLQNAFQIPERIIANNISVSGKCKFNNRNNQTTTS